MTEAETYFVPATAGGSPAPSIFNKNEEEMAHLIYNYQSYSAGYANFQMERDAFEAQLKTDCYSSELTLCVQQDVITLIHTIKGYIEQIGLQPGLLKSYSSSALIYGSTGAGQNVQQELLVQVGTRGALTGGRMNSTTISLYGKLEHLLLLETILKERYPKVATVEWFYMAGSSMSSTTFEIKTEHILHNEFFPWLEEPLHEYYQRFLNSNANILLLLGEPGTGKTSFIRDFIVSNKLYSYLTYEAELVESDGLFVDFLNASGVDSLIVEDADTLLLSRDKGNTAMAKFLNVSDGLLKRKDKKMLFTSNVTIDSLNKVDSALIRPGRCFGVLEFRPLYFDEAVVASQVAGLQTPTIEKSYTLAELTNPDYERSSSKSVIKQQHRIGFLGT